MKYQSKGTFTKTVIFSFLLLALIFSLSFLFRHFSENDAGCSSLPTDFAVKEPPVVILDPGHGGVDSGAVSVLGDEEKNLNLSLAKKVGSFLEEAGIRVIFSRTEDALLTSDKTTSRKMGDLMARVDLAREMPEAVFVSIHMNTLPIEKYSGLQVFYSSNHPLSRVLAQQIQNDTQNLLQNENHREAKDAKGSIYILDRIGTPAVLVECGFLTNQKEAASLADEEYQSRLAFTLSRSIIQFTMQKEDS